MVTIYLNHQVIRLELHFQIGNPPKIEVTLGKEVLGWTAFKIVSAYLLRRHGYDSWHGDSFTRVWNVTSLCILKKMKMNTKNLNYVGLNGTRLNSKSFLHYLGFTNYLGYFSPLIRSFYYTSNSSNEERSEFARIELLESPCGKMGHFALSQGIRKELILPLDFIEWFRGFTDAEGSFQIYGAAKGSSFTFTFGI